jgi:hypothetical protein
LTDGVDLRCVTTAGDADADIDIGCFPHYQYDVPPNIAATGCYAPNLSRPRIRMGS